MRGETWKPGALIAGRFEVKELIGVGGMGVVYRIHHREWNLDLAVKMPLPELVSDQASRDRFITEAQTWINLGVHPNVVQCFFVRDVEGLPILFLDFLAGGSLKKWIDDGQLGVRHLSRVLDFTIQAADGLAHSHSFGLVHRDVKPANLLVRDDEYLCVTDFGIVATGESNDKTLLGTPEYGAPEQWVTGKTLGPSVDLYALGVVLYEMCCGRLPFLQKDYESPVKLIRAHQGAPPPDPREFAAALPDSLAEFILRSIAKKPEERPQSMDAFRDELAQIYEEIAQRPYPRPKPEVGVERAAAFNNRGVSLYHLDKFEEADQAWDEALRLDAGHADSVFNQTTARWRANQITTEFALERLRLLESPYHYGLFGIECQNYKLAEETLARLLEKKTASGLEVRAVGDAMMYCQDFFNAEKAYERAVAEMPDDETTVRRRRMARIGKNRLEGRIYFPWQSPVVTATLERQPKGMAVHPQDSRVFVYGEDWIQAWDADEGSRSWSRTDLKDIDRLTVHPEEGLVVHFPALVLDLKTGKTTTEFAPQERVVELAGPAAFLSHQTSRVVHLKGEPCYTQMAIPADAAAFNSGKNRVAVTDRAGNLSVREPGQEQALVELRAHEGRAIQLQWFAQDRGLATLGEDRKLRYWNLGSDKPFAEVHFADDPIHFWFTPDESLVLIQLRIGYEVRTPKGGLRASGIGPARLAGDQLVCCEGETVRLMDLETGRITRQWNPLGFRPLRLELTGDTRFLVVLGPDRQLRVLEFDEQHRVYEENLLVSRSLSHTESEENLKLFEDAIKEVETSFHRKDYPAAQEALAAARQVKGYQNDQKALEFNIRLAEGLRVEALAALLEQATLNVNPPVLRIAVRTEKSLILVQSTNELVHWNFSTGQIESRLSLGGDLSGLYALESGILMSSGTRLQLRPYDGSPGSTLATFEYNIKDLAMGDRDRFVGILLDNREVHLFDLDQKLALKIYRPTQAETLDMSADLNMSLSGPEFELWNPLKAQVALKGKQLVYEGRDDRPARTVVRGDFSADNQFVLVAYGDRALRMWRTDDGQFCNRFLGHTSPVIHLRLWPQLNACLSIGSDGTGRVWKLIDGKEIQRIVPHAGPITAAWSERSGRYLVTAGEDGTVKFWRFDWEFHPKLPPEPLEEKFPAKVSAFGRLTSLFRRG